MKSQLVKLDRLIRSFVTNPVFTDANVINAELAAKARGDLDEIIDLSDKVKKHAAQLNKDNTKLHWFFDSYKSPTTSYKGLEPLLSNPPAMSGELVTHESTSASALNGSRFRFLDFPIFLDFWANLQAFEGS